MSSVITQNGWWWVTVAIAVGTTACGGSGATTSGANAPTGSGEASAGGDVTAPKPVAKSGPSAPDFTLPTLDGDTISLSDYEGDKVVLLDFWSTTCDPCLAEMPELVRVYKEKKAQGFEVLAITIDGPNTLPQVSQVVKNKGMIFPVLLDQETEVMDRYNPKGQLPFAVLIDRSGSIVLQRASFTAGDEESMDSLVAAIDGALAKK